MFGRRKKTTVDPSEKIAAESALIRARVSLEHAIERNPEDDALLCEYKKADPFGAQLFEAMKGKQ
jgi:hypothetical protein